MNKQSQEDYLRAIYDILEKKQQVKAIDIVKYLNVSKPSVSEMVRKMTKKGLIKSAPYSAIKFTKKGKKIATRLTYKHRVIEVFLKNVLKCNKKNIHQEAHQLEHAFSDQVIKKLGKLLKNPKISPYGHKIPKI